MSNFNKKDGEFGVATKAVRAGVHRGVEQEHGEPIYTTSSYVFDSAEQAAERFANREPGNIYSRFTNPSVRTFEERLAALEGAERCVATASGMSAILSVCLSALNKGDHILSSRSIFGASQLLFSNILGKFGIEVSYASLTDIEDWQRKLQPNTRMLFLESPSNPLMEIGDIAAIAALAKAHSEDVLLVVDNCFCTPILQQPLSLGADVVVHSATKFIDGQGRCVGGAVVGSDAFVGEDVYAFMRTAGPCMSPFNAWVFSKGLETLELRMQRACSSASQIAEWLQQQSKVKHVFYPGLSSHRQFQLAKQQQQAAGAVVSFEVHGGLAQAYDLINATRLFSVTANLGDTRSTITHPATTTHARWSDEEKREAGIGDSLIRLAIGLEEVDDLTADLDLD